MLKRLGFVAGGLMVVVVALGHAVMSVPKGEAPAYTADGSLMAPAHYREWVYLSSGIDMAYTASQETEHHVFDNTFVNPISYRAFLATGRWQDGTTIVLEVRGGESPVSINKRGSTQSVKVDAEEFHVKDKGKWSFYRLVMGTNSAKLLPVGAGCQACHAAHGAVDETFVQFYPTLLPVAKAKGTVSEMYLKEGQTSK